MLVIVVVEERPDQSEQQQQQQQQQQLALRDQPLQENAVNERNPPVQLVFHRYTKVKYHRQKTLCCRDEARQTRRS